MLGILIKKSGNKIYLKVIFALTIVLLTIGLTI